MIHCLYTETSPFPPCYCFCVHDKVLGMIGETLEDKDDILGAVVSIKRGQDRLAVWTRTASDEVRVGVLMCVCLRVCMRVLVCMLYVRMHVCLSH